MLPKRNTSHTQRHGHEREGEKRPAKTLLAWPLMGKTDLRPKLIQSDKAVQYISMMATINQEDGIILATYASNIRALNLYNKLTDIQGQ